MAVTDLIPWRRRKNNIQVHRERDVDDWFGSFQREMHQLMDRFVGGFDMEPLGWGTTVGHGDFVPRLDVSENDKSVTVTAELPGVDEKDIDVTVARDSLTIKGSKHEESEENGKDLHRLERRYGSFQRVVPLPAEVDRDKAEADFRKGVLRITLPKTAAAQHARKKITVKPT